MQYDHKKIERKWQKFWEAKKLYQALDNDKRKKFYALVEFPYPSGDGLHVGHPRSYTAMDIIARKRRMDGFNVLYPMGFDSFGLPTENYAIKTGKPPEEITKKNIANFTRQLKSLGFSFDWSRAVTTSDPKYYKWTQWIFLQLFKHGLAYKAEIAINWCLSCKIGLANEEVVDGKCERCGGVVEKRQKAQWMLAITKYADKLLAGLKNVDYIERAKVQQENWIGKSQGAEIDFSIAQPVKRFVLLHGRCGSPEFNFFPWLRKELETAGYKVEAPALPNASEPNDLEQADFVLKHCKIDEQTVIVGHSAGGLATLRLLERGVKPARVILVSTPFSGKFLDGKERPTVTAAARRGFDFVKIKKSGAIFTVLYDTNDHVVPMSDGESFARNLGIELQKSIGQDTHFCATQEPEILKICLPSIKVFTTRPDTLFGATYMVLAPEHSLVKTITTSGQRAEVEKYVAETKKKNEMARADLTKEKTGVFTGAYAINPATGEKIPVWIADYVMMGYGTGAIMAVPAHDERDFAFAERYSLDKKVVIMRSGGSIGSDIQNISTKEKQHEAIISEGIERVKREGFYEGEGMLVNSTAEFNGLSSEQAKKQITKKVGGKMVATYHLRDWVFSRQRYWGEPIPLVFCEKCNEWIPLPEKELPLKLPKVAKYQPTDSGESPLAAMDKWVNTKCPCCNGPARRETDTMPNWAGSSWYFLRYCDPKNNKMLADIKKLKYWMPVDWYNGGMEHTTLHLLYSRFWNLFLHDIGVAPTSEPYQKRTSHGMILAEDGEKMSKSRGNVVNPDAVVKEFGADTLRLYEMFIGPFADTVPWSTDSIRGMRRFIERVWKQGLSPLTPTLSLKGRGKNSSPLMGEDKGGGEVQVLLHKTIKKVTADIEDMRFNTAISTLMILLNKFLEVEKISREVWEKYLMLLSPFAPHVTEELWSKLGHKKSIFTETWPKYDAKLVVDSEISLVVQVNGKLRARLVVPADITQEAAVVLALADEQIKKYVPGQPKKVIFVPGKLLSLVV